MAWFEKSAAKSYECLRCQGVIPRGSVYISRMDYTKRKQSDGTFITLRLNEKYCVPCYKSMATQSTLTGKARPAWVQVVKDAKAERKRARFEPLLVGHVVHGLGRMGA